MVHEIESNDLEMCSEEPACFRGRLGTRPLSLCTERDE